MPTTPRKGERPGSADVDAALRDLPAHTQAALQHLRETIAAAAPEAVETIAYGVPAFRYRNRAFVSYGAGRSAGGTCSFYVQSPEVIDAHRADLAGYGLAKGTVHFAPERPLPDVLVRRLVQARVREIEGG